MKHKKILSFIAIAALTAALMLAVFPINSLADLGNTNRYDGGSYGGGFGGSSGGSSSWGSGSGGSGMYFFPVGGGSGNHNSFLFIVIILVIAFVVFSLIRKAKMNIDPNTYTRPTAAIDNTAAIEEEIRQTDPAFSSGKFLSYAKESFITLQNAWSERNFNDVRLLESEELYNQHKTQLEEYVRLGRINKIERLAINDAYLVEFRKDQSKEYLRVFMYAVMRDYIIDEKTEKVLEGRKDIDAHMRYILTFSRSAGTVTKADDGITATNCPNCGAPTEITSSGKCKYCGSVITSGSHSWVLSDLRKA